MDNNSSIDDMIFSDPEMLEGFLNESKECLVVAEEELKSLQKEVDEPDPASIERAFRSVHSIKSAAGFLGLEKVSHLALHMEKILGHLRKGTIVPEVNIIKLLLEGVRMLNVMLANHEDSSRVDTRLFLARLRAYGDVS